MTGIDRSSERSTVQSVERAMALLELLHELGGKATLSTLASASGMTMPTVHRLLRTLVAGSYVQQLGDRQYALGARLIPLGALASQMFSSWSQSHLERLVNETGETANLAMLDAAGITYIAQVPSRHSMRMFTEVGRRVDAHSTGVGKAILAQLPTQEAVALLSSVPLTAKTARTIVTIDGMLEELSRIRSRGYAIDDGEQEVGVRCIAVAVPSPQVRMAVSVSGPESRVTSSSESHHVPLLRQMADEIARELERVPGQLGSPQTGASAQLVRAAAGDSVAARRGR